MKKSDVVEFIHQANNLKIQKELDGLKEESNHQKALPIIHLELRY